MMIAGIDDQSSDLSDRPVRGVYAIAAAHLHLADRDAVVGDGLWTGTDAYAGQAAMPRP